MSTQDIKTKRITIRFPLPLWRRMKLAAMDGKIQSIQQAVLDALEGYLEEIELALERDGMERRW